jgi:hypothetical protein
MNALRDDKPLSYQPRFLGTLQVTDAKPVTYGNPTSAKATREVKTPRGAFWYSAVSWLVLACLYATSGVITSFILMTQSHREWSDGPTTYPYLAAGGILLAFTVVLAITILV